MRILVAALALAFASQAAAQAYPSKPIRWIVVGGAGGAFDLVTRALAPPMGTGLGQPMVVDNRASASGIVGMDAAAKSPPDGYTTLTAGNPQLVFNKHFFAKLTSDPQKDFQPIGTIANLVFSLYVHESVPAKNLAEFLAHAKANPGKLNYGTGGVGQAFHLAIELLKQRTSVELVHIPYKSNALAIQDFLAGRVEVFLYPPTGQMLAQVKEGKIRPLATANDRRVRALPDVPTFAEAGVPNLDRDLIGWVGMLVPANTPNDVVVRLNRELGRAAALPEVLKVVTGANFEPVHSSPQEMAARMSREIDLWGPLIRKLGITLE